MATYEPTENSTPAEAPGPYVASLATLVIAEVAEVSKRALQQAITSEGDETE